MKQSKADKKCVFEMGTTTFLNLHWTVLIQLAINKFILYLQINENIILNFFYVVMFLYYMFTFHV